MKKSTVEENYNAQFAAILRGLLKYSPKTNKRITYKALAEYLGVKQQSVSSWANGTTIPDTKNIAPIAVFFGVSCDYLLGLNPDVKTPDVEIQGICKKTGLSEIVATSLIDIKNNINEQENRLVFLNDLIKDGESLYWLSSAYREYKRYNMLAHEVEKIEPENPIALESKAEEDYKIFRCYNIFVSFLKGQSVLWKSKKEKEESDDGN